MDLSNMLKELTASPQYNRGLMSLAGLDPAQQAAAQVNQAQVDSYYRQQEEAEALKQLDPAMIPDELRELWATSPELAMKMWPEIAKQQAREQKNQLLQDIFAGGGTNMGGTANKVAAISAATGDPSLMPYATFLQGQDNRSTDEANRIAAEDRAIEREIEKEKRTSEKDAKKFTIPNYELMPDVTPDPVSARGARELVQAIPTYDAAIKRITKLIDKHGSTVGAGKDTDAVSQAFLDLLNAERGLNNTGVLNVGEIPTLEQVYKTFDPRNPMNLAKSKEELKAGALEYLAQRKELINGKLKSIGYLKKGGDEASIAPTPDFSIDDIDAAIARKLGQQ